MVVFFEVKWMGKKCDGDCFHCKFDDCVVDLDEVPVDEDTDQYVFCKAEMNYRQQYYYKHKDYYRLAYKKYREAHKKKLNQKKREYYIKNKERLKEYAKNYYLNNKKTIKAKNKEYQKQYRLKNQEKMNRVGKVAYLCADL